MMRVNERQKKQILAFIHAGASRKAIANRFGITEKDVESVIREEEKVRLKAEGLDKYTPQFRRWFTHEWTEITAFILGRLQKV